MNKQTVRALLLLFLTATIILQPLNLKAIAQSQFQVIQTFWGSSANPLEVGPGDKSATLNVVVQNIGLQTYSGLDVTLFLISPFSNVTSGNIARGFSSSNIQPGQTTTLQFQLNIDDDAQTGSYILTMTLLYGTKFGSSESLSVSILLLGRVDLKVSINPSSLSPGSTSKLVFTVSNKGTGTASKVSVIFTFPIGLSIGADNQWYFQSIKPNEDKTMILDAYAQPSLAGSSLQIQASMTCVDAYGTSRTLIRTVGLRILPVTNPPLVMTVKGNELHPGTLNNVTFSILNNQTKPVSSVQALLAPISGQAGGATPLVIFSDNTWFFNSIGPLKSATFSAQLLVSLAAADSNYQLTLTLSYLDPLNISRSENHVFGVRVLPAPQNVIVMTVDRNVLIAGSFNEPRITLHNSGRTAVRSITVTLSFPMAPGAATSASTIVLSTGNQWYFDVLQANSNVTFSPKIFATLGAIDTSYQAQLSISYIGEREISRTETKSLGFSVKGTISFQIFDGQVIPKTTYPGGNITLTGNLLNTGNTRAMYTMLAVKSSPYFMQSSEGPLYVGEVPINTPTPFTMSSRVRTNLNNGTYPLTLVFSYQNDYGDKYAFENTINVVVSSYIPPRPMPQPQQTGQNIMMQGLPYIVASAVAVSAVFLISRRRRKKRQK